MNRMSLFQSRGGARGYLVMLLILTLPSVCPVVYAEELLPELAGAAAKHTATNEALDKEKQEAIALATKPYLSSLDGLEKSATAKGEIDLVAAVIKEREAAVAGSLDFDLPAALPRTKLQSLRKTLLTKIEQINADLAKRKKLSDADYLRYLATLQTRADANPELAKQLASEKAALLASSADGGRAGTATKVPRGKNIVVNGNFEKIVTGKPEGWLCGSPATVAKENRNTFVRFENAPVDKNGSATSHYVFQPIALPSDVETVVISARCRATIASNLNENPAAFVIFYDKNGKEISFVYGTLPEYKGAWKTIEKSGQVPKEAVKAGVALTNNKYSGQVDFDDVEVMFK